ncbi:hypothetical protein ACHAXT_007936 [Thalassiosira profunda]
MSAEARAHLRELLRQRVAETKSRSSEATEMRKLAQKNEESALKDERAAVAALKAAEEKHQVVNLIDTPPTKKRKVSLDGEDVSAGAERPSTTQDNNVAGLVTTNSGHLVVQDCGHPGVNGAYELAPIAGAPMRYTKGGHWNGTDGVFVVQPCAAQERWMIGFISGEPSTYLDAVFYYATRVGSTRSPPQDGWEEVAPRGLRAPTCRVVATSSHKEEVVDLAGDFPHKMLIKLKEVSGEFNGRVTTFKVKPATRMTEIYEFMANRRGVGVHKLRFLVHGCGIGPDVTAAELGLDPDEEIQCFPAIG